jgi:hypothetical protein
MRKRRPASNRGAHQVVLTVRATVRRDRLDELRGRLDAMGALARGTGGAGAPSMSWAEMDGVHFARLLLLEDSTDLDERLIPASLLYMAELDAPLSRHTQQLADLGAAGLDATFSLCEGYPTQPDGAARREFLARHLIPSQANYVNTVGRTVEQIQLEEALRTSIETFLDDSDELPGSPEGVRAAIQRHVRSQPSLDWATRRAPRPSLRWRAGEALHLAGITAIVVAALPFALLVLPFYAVALRIHERRDAAPHVRPDPEHARRLSAIEDFAAQNQFSAIGYVKPGALRRVTVAVVLWLIQQAARHVFTRADLSGVKTIHFAHWTVLDEGRRVLFTSNYDNSLESYMDDFIDKVAYGLNASFSNGVGFPRTKFLFFEGAHREQEFKDHLRTRQIPTQVYYSAYAGLSARNVDNNASLRSGLFGGLAHREVETWLRRF